ncbi:hypothetical protein VCHC55A1_3198, partial [Vibrio cholerae HC-55A1]
MKLNLKAL